MLNLDHLRRHVVRAVLKNMDGTKPGIYSMAAENLLLGVAIQESGGRHLAQLNDGPACGLWQMEPATHDDIREWLMQRQPELLGRVMLYSADYPTSVEQLRTNLFYAAAMARLHFWRVPAPLPDADDSEGMGYYWKRFYNTFEGAGTVAQFVDAWRRNNIS